MRLRYGDRICPPGSFYHKSSFWQTRTFVVNGWLQLRCKTVGCKWAETRVEGPNFQPAVLVWVEIERIWLG